MSGVWKKTLNYLGLVEEDEEFVEELPDVEPAPVRRMRPQSVRESSADAGPRWSRETSTAPLETSPRPGSAGTVHSKPAVISLL